MPIHPPFENRGYSRHTNYKTNHKSKQPKRMLHPPPNLQKHRRHRPKPHKRKNRYSNRCLAMERIPWRTSPENRHRRKNIHMDKNSPKHPPRPGKSRRKLHKLPTGKNRGSRRRLRRSDNAKHQWLCSRRHRRKHLPHKRQHNPHPKNIRLDTARHNKRLNNQNSKRTKLRNKRNHNPKRNALHSRRAILHRHSSRSNPHKIRRQDNNQQRRTWPNNRKAPERILQHPERRKKTRLV